MTPSGFHFALVGAGFLAGTLGVKLVKSKAFHEALVAATVQGMKARAGYQDFVEQAKAQYDDIMAEADYRIAQEKALAESDE